MSVVPESSPPRTSHRVPGGGPASRWRPERITSRGTWIYLALALASGAVLATTLRVLEHTGTISDTGLGLMIGAGVVLLLLLVGCYAMALFALETRVDDDLLVYAAGRRVELLRSTGPDATVTADGAVLAARRAPRLWGDRVESLQVGVRRHAVTVEGLDDDHSLPAQYAWISPVFTMTDPEGRTVATATGYRRRHRQDWVLRTPTVTLRWREHVARPVPRLTVLDREGRAFRATFRRGRVAVVLPTELPDEVAAFCVAVLDATHERARLVSATVGTGYGGGVD